MPAMTAALSAICGTHLGDTNAPASTTGRPASARRSISAILVAAGTALASFWRPSRGPTSTILTRVGRCWGMRSTNSREALFHCHPRESGGDYQIGKMRERVKSASRLFHEGEQLRPLLHEIAGLEENTVDLAVHGGGDAVFHLHGFKHHQRRAALHVIAWFDRDLDDLAGHGRGQVARRGVDLLARGQRIDQ